MAVGSYTDASGTTQTLVESWNGISWTIGSSADEGAGNNTFSGISCPESIACTAVGDYTAASGTDQTLVENWNGTSWSITSSPNDSVNDNLLNGVSCTSASNCMAVGSYVGLSGIDQTLAESWNGTAWSLSATPNLDTQSGFASVSCVSATSCTAVGDFYLAQTSQALVESWNGTSWSVVPNPDEGAGDNTLAGVSCTNATFCVAVGDYVNSSGTEHTLVESWNGSSWSIVASPNQAGDNNVLTSVVCTSSTSCIAVGNDGQPLIESWSGTTWSMVGSPSEGSGPTILNSVSCVTSTDCMAVGGFDNDGNYGGLVETWDGSSWSMAASPDEFLSSVSCVSPTDCVAVGGQADIESWNGTAWSAVDEPASGSGGYGLEGVSCSSAGCAVVGTSTTDNGIESPHIFAWYGFAPLKLPTAGNPHIGLDAVSCTALMSCMAVGSGPEGGQTQGEVAEAGSVPPSPPAPTITHFSPRSGKPGSTVHITGTNLQHAHVSFNGQSAKVLYGGAKSLGVEVPNEPAKGYIEVTTPGGAVTSISKFKIT
jgi:hypothetical protein